ncbi:UDP-N-acetylmuramoyl-L-alanyl-D-glutamate--2,6-diaminopimelate ligase [Candidatus Berkelbacteria bacterium]|nr:UDP-N-acetylmuramoyl-L-alanyl-D-glutamate--2,6-diaminopimelate ligase [Candidatus Berkelbacteria bacterium]
MSSFRNYFRNFLPPSFILFFHKLRGFAAALIYGFPGRKIKVIGVTGTNGKTTTCHLIAAILEEAGYKVGMTTTIDFKIGKKVWPNLTKMTVVSPFLLSKMLSLMVKNKCDFAVLETTSHAIKQYRNFGIPYFAVVLTNLTHDHLDYHQSFAEYRETKGRLFAHNATVHVVNKDDKEADYFLSFKARQKITYGLLNHPDVLAKKILTEPGGSLFTAITPQGQITIDLPLPGRFNLENALAAIAATTALGIDLTVIKKALEKTPTIAGRMEKIENNKGFTVLVDYAHSPDAFNKIYQTLLQIKKGRIIHVFGATGDRDKTKRPIMGAIAGRFADFIILTDEDPYSEDPAKIIEEVAKGVPRGATKQKPMVEGKNFWLILDRKEAIQKAISLAQKDDIVIITGKGAEEFMVVGDKKVPFSDREVARELLAKK